MSADSSPTDRPSSTGTSGPGMSGPGSSTTEADRLRERIAVLEKELATTRAQGGPPPPRRGGRERWRSVTATVLIALACVLAPLSVVSTWAKTQVSDTDRYVQTVAPLASEPAIQQAVTDDVTRTIFQYVDVQAVASQAVDALAAQGAPPRVTQSLQALTVPLANGVESFTRSEVQKVLSSPQFAALWEQVNRTAHQQVVSVLEGEQGGALTASQNGTVTLNLGPVVAEVKSRLIADGFGLASKIPTVDRSIVLVQSDAVTKAQGLYRLLNTLGTWLPVVALVLLALGVYVAKGHRRALMLGALGVLASMLLLGVALALARPLYLDRVNPDVLPREAAGDVFDTLVRYLRNGLRATGVAALVVALGAFLTGPSTTARTVRSWFVRIFGSMRTGAEAKGISTGPFGVWVYRHRTVVRAAVAALGAVVVVLWSHPTVAVVLWTALLVVVGLGVVELVARPSAQRAGTVAVPAQTGPRGPEDALRQDVGDAGEGEGRRAEPAATTPGSIDVRRDEQGAGRRHGE
ncbi:MAG: hypothetical protein ACTHQ3_20290 [Motilibacteraceae bacterium]